MITPEYLEYALDILQVHKELQESIIRDIVRRMLKHPERLTDTAEWQLEKVQQSGILYNELVRELSRATGRLESEIRAAFDDAEGKIFDYGDKTVTAAGFDPVEFKSLSPSMKQTWEAALSKTSTEAVNLTKTTAVTVQSSYIRACDLAHMQVASGAFDYNTAIRNAVKYAAGQGVTVVYPSGYVDKLDTAIRRSLLTGINQTAGQLQNMRADSLDCDIMEITAHAGARPAHAVWQGQLVSRSGRRGYLSLSDIGYGSVTGFMGANCRHNWHMFFEGISERAYTDAQLAALSGETVEYNGEKVPLWKATDYQRRLERSVKASKRELVALDEAIKNANGELKTGLQADFEHAAQLLKKREAKLKDLCNQTGLYYDSSRCGVFSVKTENGIKSWGRSAAQKAVAAFERAKLPNYKNAVIPDKKLTDYALNKNHPIGKNKAIAFEKYLGYNIDNREMLLTEVQNGLKNNIASKRAETAYGTPFEVRMLITGANGKKAHIKTAWILDKESNKPRLTSIYVDEKVRKQRGN